MFDKFTNCYETEKLNCIRQKFFKCTHFPFACRIYPLLFINYRLFSVISTVETYATSAFTSATQTGCRLYGSQRVKHNDRAVVKKHTTVREREQKERKAAPLFNLSYEHL